MASLATSCPEFREFVWLGTFLSPSQHPGLTFSLTLPADPSLSFHPQAPLSRRPTRTSSMLVLVPQEPCTGLHTGGGR